METEEFGAVAPKFVHFPNDIAFGDRRIGEYFPLARISRHTLSNRRNDGR